MEEPKFNLTSSLKFVIFWLKIIGLWPAGEEFRTYSFYTFYSVLCFIVLAIGHNIPQIVNLYFIYNNLEVFAASLFVVMSDIGAIIKIYYFIKNLPVVKHIMECLRKDSFQPKTHQQRILLENNVKPWKTMYTALLMGANMTCLLWATFPLLDKSSNERRLPFIAWYPFDYTISPVYEITYIHQMLSIYFFAMVNVNFDGLLTAYMMYIGGQCKLLCDDLQNLYEFTKKRLEQQGVVLPVVVSNNSEDFSYNKVIIDEFNNSLLACIKYHKEILSFSKNCNTLFNYIVFFQLMTSVMTICMTLFQLTIVKPLTAEFYSLLFYQYCMFLEILMYCWMGNEAMISSSNIPFAVYKCDWIETSAEFKKNMIFFIRRTQKPIRLYAINFFVLSLETFITILRTAWSYFALLKQVNNRK